VLDPPVAPGTLGAPAGQQHEQHKRDDEQAQADFFPGRSNCLRAIDADMQNLRKAKLSQ
jgi:hypothetical protein